MTTAPTVRQAPATLAEALADLQSNLPVIAKDQVANVPTRSGGSYTYHYADLSTISKVVLPMLAERGLSWTCAPTLDANGRFVLRYQLLHVGGESIGGEYPLTPGNTAQERGSEITYARRYALTSVIGLAPAADDDGAAASVKPPTARASRSRASTKDGAGATNVAPATTDEVALKRMFAAFGAANIRDKDGQLDFIHEVTGFRPESRKDMTPAQVSAVIRALDEGLDDDHREGPA